MNKLDIMKNRDGFIAALDQSGGSSGKTLALYGISEDSYSSEEEMFSLINGMRERVIKADSFNKDSIVGTILFEKTMDYQIDGEYTADYLWNNKEILSFLKIDKGLADLEDGVQIMKPNPGLSELLDRALERNIFGTKMRSVIKEYNEEGIKKVVEQQFSVAKEIIAKGLVPIIEPEVDINTERKEECEILLKKYIDLELEKLEDDAKIMFKFTLPSIPNFYEDYTDNPHVVKVVALSGGYSRIEANNKLRNNHGVIASFSRALLEGLKKDQSEEEFNLKIKSTIESIYDASVNKD